MIDVIGQRIVQGDIDERIIKWVVWFRTPYGLSRSLPDAVALCKDGSLDPTMAITAIPVAISDSTYEEWHR